MSSDRERPKTMYELASDRYQAGDRTAFDSLPRAPHCDSRILHHPDDGCDFCAEATELQAEREHLDISNSGMQNRRYPCPADQARAKSQYEAWRGNKPQTKAQVALDAAEFAQWLRDKGIVDD